MSPSLPVSAIGYAADLEGRFSMDSHREDRARVYERSFLLSPEKRNQVMELWEVEKYGLDSLLRSRLCLHIWNAASGVV